MASRVGAPNKNKQFLVSRLKDMFGEDFDPIIKAAQNAVRMQDIADTAQDSKGDSEEEILFRLKEFELRKECVNSWDKIAKYVTPQLKAIEVTGEDGGEILISRVERLIVKPTNTDG